MTVPSVLAQSATDGGVGRLVAVGLAVVVVCLAAYWVVRRVERTGSRERSGVLDGSGRYLKDPERMFAQFVIFEAKRRCDFRCEHVSRFGRRCRHGESNGHVLHADHWIPHSKGGASSEGNIVILCARHNLAKSSEVPFTWQTARVFSSRSRYMVNAVRPGERFAEGAESSYTGVNHPALQHRRRKRASRSPVVGEESLDSGVDAFYEDYSDE